MKEAPTNTLKVKDVVKIVYDRMEEIDSTRILPKTLALKLARNLKQGGIVRVISNKE